MNKLLILVSIVGWGFWAFFNKIALQKLHPLYLQLTGVLVGVIFAPVYIAFLLKDTNNQANTGSIIIALIASLCGAAASMAYMIGIKNGELGTVSALSASYPVLGFMLSVCFLGESFTLIKIVGIGLITIGVIVLGL